MRKWWRRLNASFAYWWGHEVCADCDAVAPFYWNDALDAGWTIVRDKWTRALSSYCPRCKTSHPEL